MASLTTVAELARTLGLSRQRTHRIIADAGVTPTRFGPLLGLTPSDLAAIQRHRQTPRPAGRPRKSPTARRA